MLREICLGFALLSAMPVSCQIATTEAEAPAAPQDDIQMQTPPPVNGQAYPTVVGSEARSNYLRAGVIVGTAYDDNEFGGGSLHPSGDVTYTIWPTISLDQTNPRQHQTFTYSPGFTVYQHTSQLNNVDQNASIGFQYRFTPYAAISVRDSFQKSSNVFNQPNPLSGTPVSGSPESSLAGVVAPFADQITDALSVDLSYQFNRNDMAGGEGFYTQLHFPNLSQVPGLFDSNSRGGSAFYAHRITAGQYVGVSYRYVVNQANPTKESSETQTNTVFAFYTLYLKRTISLSVSGGPQLINATQSGSAAYRVWRPSVMASVGWQSSHFNVAASYLRTVAGGGGLVGAFESDSTNGSLRWRFTKTWTAGSVASYAVNRDLTPTFALSSSSGHNASGTITIERPIGTRMNVEAGYTRLQQKYSGIPIISAAPDSDRLFISIAYQFTRPLGR